MTDYSSSDVEYKETVWNYSRSHKKIKKKALVEMIGYKCESEMDKRLMTGVLTRFVTEQTNRKQM